MSRVESGLAYNSLTDHHLTNYFSRPRRKQHLRQSGLLRRDGEIQSEALLYAESLRKDQKQQAKEAILRSLEWRKDDLARNHQALCLRTIEEIEKIERVRRIRSGDKNGSAMSYTDLIECAIVPASICHRPISSSLTNGQELGSLCYSNKSLLRSRRSRSAGVGLRRGSGHEEDEDRLQFNNPSDYFPVLPRRRKSKKRKLRQTDRHQRKRAQSVKLRQTSAEEDDKRLPMMTMKYFGDRLHLENDQADPRVQVVVEQQHCGGNTLIVFKDKLLPGTEFSFPSYRHPGYPYSLTIYVNGRHDSRLSVCCEYKHRMNARLGGKSGNFAVVGVKRGKPCHSCMMKYGQNNRKKNKSSRDLNQDSDDSSSDSRGDNDDDDTATSRFSPAHRNRIRIPVDDEENDRDEEYGKEINRRTNAAKSPEFERKPRKSSAKKSRDPYDHFLYDIQVPVDDEDNGNNNNDGGVKGTRRESLRRESPKHESPRHESPRRESPRRESPRHESPRRESPRRGSPSRESPSREQQMKSPSQSESSSDSGSRSGSRSGSGSDSSSDSEGEEGKKGKDTYSKGSACTEEIEKVKPKSSRSQRESNHDDESASESGS